MTSLAAIARQLWVLVGQAATFGVGRIPVSRAPDPTPQVKSNNRIFVTPSFRIRSASGGGSISGAILTRLTESDIRSAPPYSLTFELVVQNDTLSPFVGHRHADQASPTATESLLDGLRSAQVPPFL